MKSKGLIVGVDLGGTRFRVCLARPDGTVLERRSWPTEAEAGPESVINRLAEAILSFTEPEGKERVIGVGLGAPGPLNPWEGVIIRPPNLPGWDRVPLRDLMVARLNLPVYLGNDANLAALGEFHFGAGRGVRHVVYMTVSTGIGGGVIVDGRLLLGSTGLAGEIGHMTIDPSGPRCNCGNFGCLEALASGTAIAREARARLREGAPTLLAQLAHGDPDNVDAAMVENAARQGDVFAATLMHQVAEYIGIGVVNVLHLFDPEMVIIGGGVSRAGTLIFDPIEDTIQRRAMVGYRNRARVVPAELGDDAGLMGAVALVASEIED